MVMVMVVVVVNGVLVLFVSLGSVVCLRLGGEFSEWVQRNLTQVVLCSLLRYLQVQPSLFDFAPVLRCDRCG